MKYPVWVQRGAQIASASIVNKLEYFVDVDPGPGNGVNLPITSAANVMYNSPDLTISSITEGFHIFYFRAQTANKIWSLPVAKPVFVQRNAQSASSPALRRLQYFVDSDTPINYPLSSSSESPPTILVDLTGVSPGFHILHLRAEDINGRWSALRSVPFLAEYRGDNIVAIDYFFTDGTSTSQTLNYTTFAPGTDVTVNFAAALSGLTPGAPYNIHVMGRNARGQYTSAAIHAFTTPAVICDPLSAPATTSNDGCSPAPIPLVASGAAAGQSYLWYTAPTGGLPIAGETSSTFTTPVLTNTTTYYAAILNGTCESARSAVTATLLNCAQPPVFNSLTATTPAGSTLVIPLLPLLSDPDNNLDTASITVIVPPFSQAIATINNGVLTLDYNGVNFAGPDYLTVQACDLSGICVQQTIYIDVVGDVVVYNALSPNNDGKNEALVIQNIEFFPETRENKLSIFNRWGSLVFQAEDYDNVNRVFTGKGDNGQDLPPGTYYFVLEFNSGAPKRTGFISLRR